MDPATLDARNSGTDLRIFLPISVMLPEPSLIMYFMRYIE